MSDWVIIQHQKFSTNIFQNLTDLPGKLFRSDLSHSALNTEIISIRKLNQMPAIPVAGLKTAVKIIVTDSGKQLFNPENR